MGCVPKATSLTGAALGCWLIVICVTAPALFTFTLPDVAAVRPVELKVSVRVPSRPRIAIAENDATPDGLVATVVVPFSAPPPLAIDATTFTPATLTSLSLASRNWTLIVLSVASFWTEIGNAVVIATLLAAPAVYVMDDAAVVRAPLENVTVVAPPTVPVSLRFVNVAVPAEAVAVVVPPSVPGPAVTAAVTTTVDVVRLPLASRMRTTGCVVNAAPLAAPAGAVSTLRVAAGPAVYVSDEAAVVSAPLENVIVVALPTVPVSESPAKVTTPLAAATVVVPPSAPGPAVIVAVTDADEPDTTLLLASRIWTTGCVVKATPLAAPAGAVSTLSLAATPAETTEL